MDTPDSVAWWSVVVAARPAKPCNWRLRRGSKMWRGSERARGGLDFKLLNRADLLPCSRPWNLHRGRTSALDPSSWNLVRTLSACCFDRPFNTREGTPTTISFASGRPRSVTSLTVLIAAILFRPAARSHMLKTSAVPWLRWSKMCSLCTLVCSARDRQPGLGPGVSR